MLLAQALASSRFKSSASFRWYRDKSSPSSKAARSATRISARVEAFRSIDSTSRTRLVWLAAPTDSVETNDGAWHEWV